MALICEANHLLLALFKPMEIVFLKKKFFSTASLCCQWTGGLGSAPLPPSAALSAMVYSQFEADLVQKWPGKKKKKKKGLPGATGRVLILSSMSNSLGLG